ncbi:MAG: hypothetical protein M1833_003666 [Piccolia ochrophora]|nr:MAG: hypothetical protein M1833_003666 [Piccolia ochrophora]
MTSKSALNQLWAADTTSPFEPALSKDRHFVVGFTLLFLAFLLTAFFSLNRSIINVPIIGIPASLAFGFGAVYTICAVGVYV